MNYPSAGGRCIFSSLVTHLCPWPNISNPRRRARSRGRGDEERHPHCAGGCEHGLQLAGHELLIDNKVKQLVLEVVELQEPCLPLVSILSALAPPALLKDLRLNPLTAGSKYHGSHSLKKTRVLPEQRLSIKSRQKKFILILPVLELFPGLGCFFPLCFTSVIQKFLAEFILGSLGISHCSPH